MDLKKRCPKTQLVLQTTIFEGGALQLLVSGDSFSAAILCFFLLASYYLPEKHGHVYLYLDIYIYIYKHASTCHLQTLFVTQAHRSLLLALPRPLKSDLYFGVEIYSWHLNQKMPAAFHEELVNNSFSNIRQAWHRICLQPHNSQ